MFFDGVFFDDVFFDDVLFDDVPTSRFNISDEKLFHKKIHFETKLIIDSALCKLWSLNRAAFHCVMFHLWNLELHSNISMIRDNKNQSSCNSISNQTSYQSKHWFVFSINTWISRFSIQFTIIKMVCNLNRMLDFSCANDRMFWIKKYQIKLRKKN